MEVDLEGQGHRSKVKVKHGNCVFNITVSCLWPFFEVKVKGWGQGQRSRSNVWCIVVDIRGSACLNFGVKWSLPVWGLCPCVCNQGAYADNLADAVYRLLIEYTENQTRVIMTLKRESKGVIPGWPPLDSPLDSGLVFSVGVWSFHSVFTIVAKLLTSAKCKNSRKFPACKLPFAQNRQFSCSENLLFYSAWRLIWAFYIIISTDISIKGMDLIISYHCLVYIILKYKANVKLMSLITTCSEILCKE